MSMPPLASIIPWEQVCRMLEKVQGEKRPKKKEMLLKFITHFRELHHKKLQHQPDCPDTFFPVMRVLLPGLDRTRGAYGVKERRLADLYIRILGLKKDGNDAQKLINFRKPKALAGGETGDFAEIAYYVLRSRCLSGGKLTLLEVDQQLTSIAENHAAKNHEAVERSLLVMLNGMSAKEQKWLLRVLLKDMRLGLGQTAIFAAWHPDAKDYYDVTNSLEKVCKTLQDPAVRLHEVDVSLFCPFRPMLAQRAVLEKVEAQMNHKSYFAETKFDGERSQIHKKGGDYKYFSRNGFDFTSNFGADRHCGLFTPHLHSQLAPHVRDVILDGEMVGWSRNRHCIVTKGELMDVKHLKEEGDWQVCFCAFDIIYLNGKVLTNKPLGERLEVLRSVVTPLEGRVLISATTKVRSREEVVAALNEAIDRREEGVVLKDPDSVYQPASRRAGWIKVKPEYVDSLVPELDLVIIGGFYGKGTHHGALSHFLLGVAVPSEEPGGKPRLFHSFTRVGSGYTVDELQELVDKLKPHTRARQPTSVCVGRQKVPDVWIEPCKSFVVQVRAAEVVKSDLYRTGVTLRFPRVERVRYDKPWHQALTTTELRQLVQEASGKLAMKHCGDELDGGRGAKRRAVARVEGPSLPLHFRPADVSSTVKKDEIFASLEMCVMSGDEEMSKQALEMMVVEHGGSLTQHPGPNTHCIVANTPTIRVQNYITSSKHNVVLPSWVVASCSSGRLLPWGPLDILHLREKERNVMQDMFDQFGDSYTEPTDGKTLRRVMMRMKKESWRVLSEEEMSEMDEKLCDPGDLRALFRRVTAYFCEGEVDQLARLTLRLHGGVLSDSPSSVTHLIAGEESEIRASELAGRHLVTPDWIYESVERGKRLEERLYMPRLV
ncbi:hypothetical protein O3P69_009133 [Scylla paramamosain]|uniref:DNA ligase 4 n=1 Tax=Scylla paramamosain TaxID=85552 RepID=A0AAW0TBW1_SCYPA